MKPLVHGDPLIVWYQPTQSLRRARFLTYDLSTKGSPLIVDTERHQGSFPMPNIESTRASWTVAQDREGILWIRGTDLDSPEAHAMLVAFHMTYRSK